MSEKRKMSYKVCRAWKKEIKMLVLEFSHDILKLHDSNMNVQEFADQSLSSQSAVK